VKAAHGRDDTFGFLKEAWYGYKGDPGGVFKSLGGHGCE